MALLTSMAIFDFDQMRRLQKLSEVKRSELYHSENESFGDNDSEKDEILSQAMSSIRFTVDDRIEKISRVFAREQFHSTKKRSMREPQSRTQRAVGPDVEEEKQTSITHLDYDDSQVRQRETFGPRQRFQQEVEPEFVSENSRQGSMF